jgi:L-cysteine:1D-myo-inositol 2-amino-2-deoxy-alpha-D-glucopyranoside ligase
VRLFDERTGTLRDLDLRPRMGVYVCGITPYDSAHLGHAFTYVQFDVLVRYLRFLGAEVDHVQNVTDVDDDILRTARARGVPFLELAEREVRRFERDMRTIGVAAPTHSPRATGYVPHMVADVRRLVAAGCAYERGGTVYFRVGADHGYGRLSGLDRDTMIALAAERGGFPDDPRKDDPLDFVLWQRSAPGEPSWESPWGPGRPGWHIECSTMARDLLGGTVDVHGGGTDLVFPHHESELAQALAAHPDEPFVLRWMHAAMVAQSGTKMSKSLGNLTFIHDLATRYPPAAIRRMLLRHHYREDWEFREEELAGDSGLAEAARDERGERDRASFLAALDEDLDTPRALAILERAEASGDPGDRSWVEEGRAILGLSGLSEEADRAAAACGERA